jgi:hypothetical protein
VNLAIDLRGTLLYAFVDQEIDLGSSVLMMQQITNLAKEKGLSKILVDGRFLTGALSDLERFDLAVKTTDHLREIGTHPTIALVGGPPTSNGLAAMAAQAIGQDVRLFPSIQEAIEWLNQPPMDLWR